MKDTNYQQTRYFPQNQYNNNNQIIMNNQIRRSHLVLRDSRFNNNEINQSNFQNDLYQPIRINPLSYSTTNQSLKRP